MSKTRTPVSATCLITNPNLCGGISDATSPKGWGSQTEATVSTTDAPIQNPECPELIAVSPPGAYAGRAKWALADVIGGSKGADSVTTPC